MNSFGGCARMTAHKCIMNLMVTAIMVISHVLIIWHQHCLARHATEIELLLE